MIESWKSLSPEPASTPSRFTSLTFTVQKEVADRLAASQGPHFRHRQRPASAHLAGSASARSSPPAPSGPPPQVASQIVRIDFDADSARQVRCITTLRQLLQMAFTQRRKQIGSTVPEPVGPPSPGTRSVRP